MDHRYAIEDLRVEHNTFHDLRGTAGNIMTFATQPIEGFRVADNLFWLNGGTVFNSDECSLNTPSCAGDGEALMADFGWNFDWTHNTMIAGWTDETGTTARSSKAYITSAMPAVDAYLQSEMPGDVDWRNAAAGDFRLLPSLTHKSGGSLRASDGLDRGVNAEQLVREVGTIQLFDVLGIGSTSATVPFLAPDQGSSCVVAYGTGDDPGVWTGRSGADTAALYRRSIALSALSPATEYRYRVWCAGAAQSETRRFRTAQ